jgi:WD40 repeat protein
MGRGDTRHDAVAGAAMLLILAGTALGQSRPEVIWMQSGAYNGDISSDVSPDGAYYAVAGADKLVRIFSISTGELIRTLHEPREHVHVVRFSPGGEHLLAGGYDWDQEQACIVVWNAADWSFLRRDRHNALVNQPARAIVFPDAQTYVSIGGPRVVHRQLASGDLLIDFSTYGPNIFDPSSGVVAPGGSVLIVGGQELDPQWGHVNAIRHFDLATGAHLGLLGDALNTVRTMAISGSTFIVGGALNAEAWDYPGSTAGDPLGASNFYVLNARFSSDGTRLVLAGASEARIYETGAWFGPSLFLGPHSRATSTAVFTPDGEQVITSAGDSRIRIWDIASSQLIATLNEQTGPHERLGFSPDGSVLVTGGSGVRPGHPFNTRLPEVKLWNAASGELLQTLEPFDAWLDALAVSPPTGGARATFAGAGRDTGAVGPGEIRVWSLDGGQLLHSLSGHSALVTALDYLPSGDGLVSGSFDGTLSVWDLNTGASVNSFAVGGDRARHLAVAPDGQSVVVGVTFIWNGTTVPDPEVKLFDLSGQFIRQFDMPPGIIDLSGVAFSPDGTKIAAATSERIFVWDVATGSLLRMIEGQYPAAVAFSPDSEHVGAYTAGWPLIRFWRIDDGTETVRFEHEIGNRVSAIRFSPDGAKMAYVRPFDSTIVVAVSPFGESEGCWADCDGNEVLNVDDFVCFINMFADGMSMSASQQLDYYANCDGSGTEPILNVDDFICFINKFSAGCE